MFINYRGEDSHSYGALLYQELRRRFGEDRVFLDCESIPAGADFVAELLSRVRSAPVLLAVIGPRWLTATDTAGRRRIDNPQDWIRRELAEAFTAGVRVIPVLTEQIAIPAEADLPAEIAALSRCQYRRLRHHDSTADLARIVTDLTRRDPTLAAAARSRDGAPRQLIGAPRHFVGRLDQLAALDHVLTTPDGPASDDSSLGDSGQAGPGGGVTAVISAIGGAGGIGKTWLALTWAHRNLHRFPDGQLSVDLRGFSPGDPAHPADVLADFLAALGVDREHQPTDLDARAALYRTHTTGKRLLILLDNAATTDQIEPLLPGGTTCTVLITSRHRLLALTARHGARPVHVDVLTDTEGRTLLHTALDDSHTHTHDDTSISTDTDRAITELIGLCHGFPLALGLVAARIRTHPDLLHDLVTDLRDLGVEALGSADLTASLPTVLSWSLRHLTEQQRTVFGLLGIAPGPDTTLPAVTSLTSLPQDRARKTLSVLEEASLLERRPGGRYVMHDLVGDYAATTAHDLPDDMRETALTRVMDFHRHTAVAANHLLVHNRTCLQPDPPMAGVCPHPLADAASAMAWMEAEHATLLATQRAAVTLGRHHLAWHLARNLHTFQDRRGHLHDAATVWRAALEAAAHLPDPATRIIAHRRLGRACSRLGLHEEATKHLNQALALAVHHHNLAEQAHAHRVLSTAWARRGDDRRALEHARHALDLHRTLDQPLREATALNQVGWLSARLGEFDTARDHCHAALTLHRHLHESGGEAATLDSLGFIAHRTGDHHQALDHYHQALTLYRTLGNTYEVANTLDDVGHPYIALGQHEPARAVWREALELYREQRRDTDTARVQRQLDDLDGATDSPTDLGTGVGPARSRPRGGVIRFAPGCVITAPGCCCWTTSPS